MLTNHKQARGGVTLTTDRDEVHDILLEVEEEVAKPFQMTIGTVVMGSLPHHTHRTDPTILHITTVGVVLPHMDDGNEEDLPDITTTNEEEEGDHRHLAIFEEEEEDHSGEVMVGRTIPCRRNTVPGVRQTIVVEEDVDGIAADHAARTLAEAFHPSRETVVPDPDPKSVAEVGVLGIIMETAI